MSFGNLEKLRIVEGNDMHPSIAPDEMLLLDKTLEPKAGDVVLFENRFGIKIAHRLLHQFGGYYFTKGDNCAVFDFPFRKGRLVGVVVGKSEPIQANHAAVLLSMFLPYFIAYSALFDLKKKRSFLMLIAISKLYPYRPLKAGADRKRGKHA